MRCNISISVDVRTAECIDQAAKARGVTRSQLLSDCFLQWYNSLPNGATPPKVLTEIVRLAKRARSQSVAGAGPHESATNPQGQVREFAFRWGH
jgi:hypothetical protein